MKKNLIIGTRASKLALWQAHHVAALIEARHPEVKVTLKHIVTSGDKIQDVPLAKIGGKGLFTKELENAMLSGEIDLAVHSLKDMPVELPAGLQLAAITVRENAGDALVAPTYGTIDKLPKGAKVGTSSLRRRAQLKRYRPDLAICELRGNVDTRLKKLDTEDLDAIVLAVAGLSRLGWGDRITEVLSHEVCLPAVGQGALAIETRGGDREVLALLEFLNDVETRQAVTAERAFLRVVEGGCQVPVGVHATVMDETLALNAVILSIDGQEVVSDKVTGAVTDAAQLGQDLAQRMLKAGGAEILRKVMELA
ncbi:MAG: hydroxymethylbilane synthase [Pelosinus sp.]|nr:hydroxymethylbilane synthase [Pelosinus sp.]